MTSHCGRVGGRGISRLAKRSGSTMIAISRRHSSSHETSMPRYGNMPTGASPAKRLGGRASAGCKADLNSSHRDDHSTSRRGGSGHWVRLSGMVSTSFIVLDGVIFWGDSYLCSVPDAGTEFLGDYYNSLVGKRLAGNSRGTPPTAYWNHRVTEKNTQNL